MATAGARAHTHTQSDAVIGCQSARAALFTARRNERQQMAVRGEARGSWEKRMEKDNPPKINRPNPPAQNAANRETAPTRASVNATRVAKKNNK